MVAGPRHESAKRVLLLGVLFHVVYLYSIFDIYFVSPVVHVSRRFNARDGTDEPPLADRLVLIVGDGLRADKLFQLYPNPPFATPHSFPAGLQVLPQPADLTENATTPAPYLRTLITGGKAAWGVSHTRVPTESRPGHVALLAGMYEDVSAVTKGWKINPVEFDSILNQSTHAWGFGSPDIVPMFVQGADAGKADMWCYDAAEEDYSADATMLDTWVLDRVEELFANASTSRALDIQLRHSGNIFFLHLLGLDTTGHSYRPHGPEYHRNIAVVDTIVARIERLFDEFYEHDGRTSYVFTADHGMSNIGNHGDGNPDSTRTPLIAWGSGVRPSDESVGDHDDYSRPWGLLAKRRSDVEQADVTALMAALVGLPYPGNSIGRLPLQYLNADPPQLTRTALANALGILEQFEEKHHRLADQKIAFRPFADLAAPVASGLDRSSISRTQQIQSLIASKEYQASLAAIEDLVDAGLDGLRYVQTYDWLSLRIIVVLGYLGWMASAATFVIRTYVLPAGKGQTTSWLALSSVWAILIAFYAKLFIESSPITYYLYGLFPALFWTQVMADLEPLLRLFRNLISVPSSTMNVIAIAAYLELAVLGYFRRSAWALGFLVLGVIWPFAAATPSFRSIPANRHIAVAWALSCVTTSIFTFLPVEKGESLPTIAAGALVFIMTGTCVAVQARRPPPPLGPWRQPSEAVKKTMHDEQMAKKRFFVLISVETCLCSVSLAVALTSAMSLQAKQGLPLRSQILGWLVFVAASATPFIGLRVVRSPIHRLLALIGGFAPIFILLSISYEVLFYFCFSLTLLLWLVFERRLAEHARGAASAKSVAAARQTTMVANSVKLDARHIRLALCFLHFIHVGFFGTGNVASISSFYLEPVYRLVPVFDPFLMSALLIYKILIPFAIVSAVFSAVHAAIGVPPFSIFLVALALSDVLTLNFFFLVRDQGSWLEIGQSISHFSIASLLIAFVLVLHLGGERLMKV